MLGIYTKEIMIVFFFALSFLLGSTDSEATDKEPSSTLTTNEREEI